MTLPLVNVLIRSAGRPFLIDALRTVFEQTYPNIAVVVLDVSGESSLRIPSDMLSRVRLIESPVRLSRALAANRLLQEATGDLAVFLDDDDWFAPDHIGRLVLALLKKPRAFMAYSDVSAVAASTELDGAWTEVKKFDSTFDPLRLLIENYIPLHAALFRITSVKSAGIEFDNDFDLFEDWDFWLSCLWLGEFVHVPEVTAFYRVHGSAGMGVQLSNASDGDQALNKLLAKWRVRWTVEQLHDLVGLSRHVYALKAHESILLGELNECRLRSEQDCLTLQAQHEVVTAELEGARQRSEQHLLTLQAQHEAVTAELEGARQRSEQHLLTLQAQHEAVTAELEGARQRSEQDLLTLQAQHDLEIVELEEIQKGLKQELSQLKVQRDVLIQELNGTRQKFQQAVERAEGERAVLAREALGLGVETRQLRSNLADYESSRSWRITKPLRTLADFGRGLRTSAKSSRFVVSVAERLLAGATVVYRSNLLRPLVQLIPSEVKRAVRNTLMRLAFPGRHSGGSLAFGEAGPATTEHTAANAVSILVSILIPVYNHAEYLEQCVASALGQTWENTEVVVVDDASPDPRVAAVLRRFEGHPRLRLHRHPKNLGICHAQNTALVASQGEIVAFLDCDDYLAPTAIEACMQAWRTDTVYLHTGRINVDSQGQEINRINFDSLPREDYFQENLRAMYATHLKVIRRDAFARVGLFDPRFDSAQDYEMLMRIAFHYPSSAFVHASDFVYFHRLHGQQTTETQRERQDELTRVIQHEARLRVSIRDGSYPRMLSVIMLSYGKHSQTLKAIRGLKATVKVPHEIILYDNGSVAETVDFLREHIDGQFEGVKVFYGDRNLGPAQGRRVALEKASGEWFVIFDNDEVPEPGWIEELLLRAEANPRAGAVCCRVVFPDGKLQFSGGRVHRPDPDDILIDLALHDRGVAWDDLASCGYREVDWCPIGATLFTENIAPYLHDGYPNTFEDAGVSFALKKKGRQLLNAPGALVWHDHITFQPKAEMKGQYMRDRYNPSLMLKSIHSFFAENGLLIHDEYIWRENGLDRLPREQVMQRLAEAGAKDTVF